MAGTPATPCTASSASGSPRATSTSAATTGTARSPAQTIARQGADGSWDGDVVETSFALLFLARGRHPILMNKLAYQGFWNNRPRDTANLGAYAGKRLEREFNWQVVDVRADWTDWLDSPVLYIAGHQPIPFRDADLAKLRAYVEAGGMIFTHADGDSGEFNRYARVLATKLFPQYELTDLPAGAPALHRAVRPQAAAAAERGAERGAAADGPLAARPRQGVAPARLAEEPGDVRAGRERVRLRRRQARLPQPAAVAHMPESQGGPNAMARVARLKYAGNWDPEPGAWRHYAAVLKQRTSLGLEVSDVPLKQLRPARRRSPT